MRFLALIRELFFPQEPHDGTTDGEKVEEEVIKKVVYTISKLENRPELKSDYSISELSNEQPQVLELSTLDFNVSNEDMEEYEKQLQSLKS